MKNIAEICQSNDICCNGNYFMFTNEQADRQRNNIGQFHEEWINDQNSKERV